MRTFIAALVLIIAGCRIMPAYIPSSSGSCFADPPDTDITEISIHRDGCDNGFFLPPNAPAGTPYYSVGPCAGYSMTLRANGTAVYVGELNVPHLGRRNGRIERAAFQHLARLANEMRFQLLAPTYAPKSKGDGQWTCVTMDGEGPLTLSVSRGSRTMTVRHEQNHASGPEWLAVFEQEVERAADAIEWNEG